MNNFQSARVKLTSWYVAIIMIISICFSALVYRNIMTEVDRGLRSRAIRTPFYTESFYIDDQRLYSEIKAKLIFQLFIVNFSILLGSSIAGYVLAGMTLRPIEEALEDQKRFVSDASHELRTPLTSLKTEIEVALRSKKLTIKEASKLLESNLEEVNRMQSLSNYLLSLSRYENGEKKLPKKKFQLNKLVEKVIGKFERQLKEKNVSIITDLNSVSVFGNETSIEELVSILLDNAIKYSEKNGTVSVNTKARNKSAILEVKDEGMGIKASDIPYIFNRFYRADISRGKQRIEGYGLGLAIAKSIVDMHEGRISVVSETGKGSIFKVCI